MKKKSKSPVSPGHPLPKINRGYFTRLANAKSSHFRILTDGQVFFFALSFSLSLCLFFSLTLVTRCPFAWLPRIYVMSRWRCSASLSPAGIMRTHRYIGSRVKGERRRSLETSMKKKRNDRTSFEDKATWNKKIWKETCSSLRTSVSLAVIVGSQRICGDNHDRSQLMKEKWN